MINQKLTDKPQFTGTLPNDSLLHVVLPNDLTQGADGSDYKILVDDLLPQAGQDNIDIRKSLVINADDTYEDIADRINALPPYTITETQSLWYVCREAFTRRTILFKLMLKGKGTYGVGNIQITTSNLELIRDNVSDILDIENDPETDTILYGSITGQTISEWLNEQTEAVVIQPQDEGYTIFKGSIDGEQTTYLWIGEAGVYGDGESQSTMADFELLSDIPVTDDTNYVKKDPSPEVLQEIQGTLGISDSLGIGTSTPEASLHIADGNALILDRYKPSPLAGANILGRAFNGTKVLPTTVLDGEVVAIFGAVPYNGVDAEGFKAGLTFSANGNQSETNRGTKADISITPLNELVPSKSVLNADTDRVLLSDASVTNAAPVAVGWFGKGEIPGENPHKFQVVSDGLNPTISFGQFGGVGSAGNAGGHLWASRGTATSPTAILSGDYLWSWGFRGQGTTQRAPSSANMSIRATEDFTDTAHGTQILFGTNATGHNANLGRTSEFVMDSDGYFRAEKVEVQSYSNGKTGNFKLRYASSNANSRSWLIANDYDAFGELAILQSTTQTGNTYAKIISVDPDGNATFIGTVKVANAVNNDEAVNLGQLNGYVTLSTAQTVTGVKDFPNSMTIPDGIASNNPASIGQLNTTNAAVLAAVDLAKNLTGWAQYSGTNYTIGSPLVINSGNTSVLANNGAASTITTQLPTGVTAFVNTANGKITPQNDGDFYVIDIRFKATSSSVDGVIDIGIDIGGAMGIIRQHTISLRKGIGVEQRVALSFPVFSGSTFVANGGEVKVTSIVGNTSIYDVTFVVDRTHKAK